MSWRAIAASIAGTSHTSQGTGCQDECLSDVFEARGAPWLALIVADGAGSATHGALGAQVAVEAAAKAMRASISTDDPDEPFARTCFEHARQAVLARALEQSIAPRELASTLLAVFLKGQAGIAFQIGDGAIVLGDADGMRIPIAPMNGEYVNSTRFVTDDDAAEQMAVAIINGPINRVAVFSDGVQALGVHDATTTPHVPFFQRLFDTVANAPMESEEALENGLRTFLSRDEINSRTDDDKTLTLAVWRTPA